MTTHRFDWLGGFFVGLGLGIMVCTTILGFQQRRQERQAEASIPAAYVVPADVRVNCIAVMKNPCAKRGARIIGDGPTVEAAVRAMQEDLQTVACE